MSPSRLPSNEALNVKATQRNEPNDVELIYQRYLQAFKKGVYNYIKEEQDPLTQQTIPRKYFSGGVFLAMTSLNTDSAMQVTDIEPAVLNSPNPKAVLVEMEASAVTGSGLSVAEPAVEDKFIELPVAQQIHLARQMGLYTGAPALTLDYNDPQLDPFYRALYETLRSNSGETEFWLGGSDIINLIFGSGEVWRYEVNLLWKNPVPGLLRIKPEKALLDLGLEELTYNSESSLSLWGMIKSKISRPDASGMDIMGNDIFLKWSLARLTDSGIEIYAVDKQMAEDMRVHKLRLSLDEHFRRGIADVELKNLLQYNLIIMYRAVIEENDAGRTIWTIDPESQKLINGQLDRLDEVNMDDLIDWVERGYFRKARQYPPNSALPKFKKMIEVVISNFKGQDNSGFEKLAKRVQYQLDQADRAMKYTDGRGHLRLDSFALPAVPLPTGFYKEVTARGKVTVMDGKLSKEVVRSLQAGGFLDEELAYTPKLNMELEKGFDHVPDDYGYDEFDGKPLKAFLGIDRKFSMLYGDFYMILKQVADEMKGPETPQPMPINNVPAKEGELVNQVYWSVQVKTPQGDRPFIVHIRNSYHQVVPVNSHREADYQIFVTSQKEYQDRGLHWDDLCGHVILKFNEGNILSNPSLEVQVGLRFRQKFPWLFGFVKERLAEQLQKPFDAANADLKPTPQGSKEYFIDERDLDSTALEDDYNNQFSSFLDNLLAVLGFDGARLNEIVAQESQYHGVKWDYRGVKLFQDVFNRYFWNMKGRTLAQLSLEFPSLAGLWVKIPDDISSDKFGFISTWIMDRYKELKQKDNHGQLLNFKIDVARFVQTVIVQEYRYIAESRSMAHVLANQSWNCWSISCLTTVLMGLWGIPGVSVVEVAQLPDGRRLPLPGGIGHAANLVWEGNEAVYVDQGSPPEYSNVRVKVIMGDTEKEAAIDELKPGLQGLTMDRIFELYKAQNDFKRIMERLKKCPGIGVTPRGNVFCDITGENAAKMIKPLSEVILDIEDLSSRTIGDAEGSVNILALDWQFRNKVHSILSTFGRIWWRAQRFVEQQKSRERESNRRAFAQSASDYAQLADQAMRTESQGAKKLKAWAEMHRGQKVDETQAELGRRFGLDQWGVSRILSRGEYGIETAGAGREDSEGAKQLKAWAEMNRGKKVDETLAELGKNFGGLTKERVRQILSEGEYGIKTRGSGRRKTEEKTKDIAPSAQEDRAMTTRQKLDLEAQSILESPLIKNLRDRRPSLYDDLVSFLTIDHPLKLEVFSGLQDQFKDMTAADIIREGE